MNTQELSGIRKSGMSDETILREYQRFAPHRSQDIDEALKGGKSPKEVLERLAQYNTEYPDDDPDPEDRMASRGVLEKTKGAIQYGTANVLSGLGSTAHHLGWEGGAESLKSGARAVAPDDYEAAGSHFDITDPSTYGYAPRALLEGAPGFAADLVAGGAGSVAGPGGAVAAFMASNASRNLGANIDARMEHQGPGAKPTSTDYAAAGLSTAAEAALSRVGLGPAISSVAKGGGLKAVAQVPKLIAKATGAEAAAAAAGDTINQVGRTAGTANGFAIDPKEVGNTAALSGMTAGNIRAARGVGDLTNAARFRNVEEGSAARLVERLDRYGGDTSSPAKAYDTVRLARSGLDAEIRDASDVVAPLLRSEGNDTATDGARVALRQTVAALNDGRKPPEGSMDALREQFGHVIEGNRLLKLLEERQVLNTLTSKGRFNEEEGRFEGGATGSKIGRNIIDPRAILRSRFATGGAAAAGVAGLAVPAQALAAAPHLATAIGTQTGLYAGLLALDKALGRKNPAGEFMARFRGDGEAPEADLPSFRQQARDATVAARALRKATDGSEPAEATQGVNDTPTAPRPQEADYSGIVEQARAAAAAMEMLKATEPSADTGRGPLRLTIKPNNAERSQASPAVDDVSPDVIRITVGAQSVDRPRDAIRNVKAYAAKTRDHMERRQSMADDLKAAVDGAQHAHIDAMLTKLNKQAHTWLEAQSIIEDMFNDMPESAWKRVGGVYDRHEANIRATYRN